MDRCRPAVPVWIMPIYRIAEQVRIQPNMFDVVIVDEASQAGLEATFLQYLAPKIVVIGDDKQVSPSAVGVDQQQLRDLANQYLADDRYKASWQDPKRSLFDEATMRYGGQITLVEHRRCVPEIIGFSNRIAYEPDGVRLIPVRQFGADRSSRSRRSRRRRLRGGTSKTNPAEVDAIVDQIEKCLADPRYDGLTFGVISLLGTAQAKLIETKLLDASPRRSGRRANCAAAMRRTSRDPNATSCSCPWSRPPNRAASRRTHGDMYVQRYNVAASRAKDQMWLFHIRARSRTWQTPRTCASSCSTTATASSTGRTPMTTGSLSRLSPRTIASSRSTPCSSSASSTDPSTAATPSSRSIPPRATTSIWSSSVPKGGWPSSATATLARPGRLRGDLARQRDLERCGWQFFRVRESAFYVDPDTALAGLWQTLDALGTWQPKAAECAATLIEASTRAATSDEAISDGGDELELAGLDLLELAWKKDAPEPVPPDALDQLATLAVEVPAPTGAAALPRLASEEAWTEAELDEIVDDLRTMIERTTSLVSSLEREIAGPMRGTEREQRLTALKSESAKMLDLGAAIRKVGAGTFGLCERCSEPIGRLRLLARPHARHCLDCSGSRA